jgi:hypothetical protein
MPNFSSKWIHSHIFELPLICNHVATIVQRLDG